MDLFRQDRLAGTLLGAAVNDASGVVAVHSGLLAAALGRELSLERDPEGDAADPARIASSFRRALVGWSLRHPWMADVDTLHACGCIALGMHRTGTTAPTSGAAMRAAIVGAAMPFHPERRRAVGRAVAEITHADERSIEAALFVAEVAAACVLAPANGDRTSFVDRARSVVRSPELAVALHYALDLVEKKVTMDLAARELGTSNDAAEAIPLAAFAFARFGDSPEAAMDHVAAGVGNHARACRAILGAWLGTLSGAACLPWNRVARLREGPFGPARLRELAAIVTEGACLPRPVSGIPRIVLCPDASIAPPPAPSLAAPGASRGEDAGVGVMQKATR